MSKLFKIAMVGVGGAVEQELATVLGERGFPLSALTPLASVVRAGESIEFLGDELPVGFAESATFADVDIVFTAADRRLAAQVIPKATEQGAVVIDLTGAWQSYPDAPLVIPEVNPEDLTTYSKSRVIGNPSSVAVPLAVALAPLHRKAGLRRVVISTYQAVSDLGRPGLDELSQQITGLLGQQEYSVEVFPKRIAFNSVPQVGTFDAEGDTDVELGLRHQLQRLLGAAELGVAATCVYVPLFNGHAAAVTIELASPLAAEEARELLKQSPGIMVMDDPTAGLYPTQADAESTEATLVGRIRRDPSVPHGICLWCVADNLRKGTATNAVQTAEILARDHLTPKT